MSETKQYQWRDNLDLVLKILTGVLIPVTIVIAGHLVARQQQQDSDATLKQQRESDLAERNADRAANLLKFLASENVRERQLAVRVVEHLVKENQLPAELGPALINVSLTDPDPEVARVASESLPQIYQSNPGLEKSAVAETQRILRNNGYYDGAIDGNNDERTREALRRFQRENGIESDGAVRAGTLQRLRDAQQRRQSQTAPTEAQKPQRPLLRSRG
jgi:murein L,D-transpeptidase YcbB/YkuD